MNNLDIILNDFSETTGKWLNEYTCYVCGSERDADFCWNSNTSHKNDIAVCEKCHYKLIERKQQNKIKELRIKKLENIISDDNQ